jgi:hypothetical protein
MLKIIRKDIVVDNLSLSDLNIEVINKNNVVKPAKAPSNLFRNSIHVWVGLKIA